VNAVPRWPRLAGWLAGWLARLDRDDDQPRKALRYLNTMANLTAPDPPVTAI
jgi:hypothetical protein